MTIPIETAHQTIKSGVGYASAATLAGMNIARLMEILRGRTMMSAHEAAGLGAVTGIAAASLAGADADHQFLTNRNTAL